MGRPVLYSVIPFDATTEHIFKFSYTGNQAQRNRLVIKNNQTLEIIYDKTINKYRLEHEIPANALKNGNTYSVKVQVFDVSGNESDFSNEIIFTCLSTPIFGFKNLISNQVIQNITYEITLTYSQAQGEKLNSFYVVLYDSNNQAVHQSSTKYSVDDLSYVLEGLTNSNAYYIAAYGQTVNGMSVATPRIPFTVEYLQPSVFSVIQLENDRTQGVINIKSNMILVEGKYDGSPVYVNGARISLLNGIPVVFDEGFNLTANFSMQVKLTDFNVGKPIIDIDDGDVIVAIHKANVDSMYAGQYYAQLIVKSGAYSYVIFSNNFSSKSVMLNIRRMNNLFSLSAMEVSE